MATGWCRTISRASQQGDFFGWPYAYSGPHPDPTFGPKRPDLVAKTKMPDVLFARAFGAARHRVL